MLKARKGWQRPRDIYKGELCYGFQCGVSALAGSPRPR